MDICELDKKAEAGGIFQRETVMATARKNFILKQDSVNEENEKEAGKGITLSVALVQTDRSGVLR